MPGPINSVSYLQEELNNNGNSNASAAVKGRTKQQYEAILQLQTSIDQGYHILFEAISSHDRNDLTIIKTVQQIARNFEEIFRLQYEQADLAISCICEYIIKGCRARSFTDSQCRYIYEAFSPVEFAKYKRVIDHSTSQSLSRLRDRKEDSSIRYALFKYHILEAFQVISPVGSLEREHHQDAAEYILDKYNDYETALHENKISLIKKRQEDFFNEPDANTQGTDDGSGNNPGGQIKYGPTKPAKTILSEACIKHGKKWILAGQSIEDDGLVDPESGITMIKEEDMIPIAQSIEMHSWLLDSIVDRKWRLGPMQWADVIIKARDWFKHTASTASRIKDFLGFYRCVTREHIGSRMQTMPELFKKYVELEPHYYQLLTIWMPKVRLPREARFSNKLSPKLSESSLR